MRLSSAVVGAVVMMTALFAMFLIFNGYFLFMLFFRHRFYGEEYFVKLLTQYVGAIVFSAIGLAAGTIVLYKSKRI